MNEELLRPYQKEGIDKIFTAWRNGKNSVLFQMPTGTGKTVLFSEIVKQGFQKKRKILIVVHRIELIEQISKKLQDRNVEIGFIVSDKIPDSSQIVQIASIQTLSKREHPEANLIIIDECHHAKAETYRRLWEIYPDAKFLGVTATPIRMSGEGFDDLFDELIISMPVQKFIEGGHLVPIKHFVCSNPDLSGIKQRQGDYVTKMLANVMMDNAVMSDLIESYKEKINGKSTIVFAVDVDHSKEIVERYRQAGISAEHIDATTPKLERQQILSDFKNKLIQVISNVEIITEGFDFPECEAVQLARPTKSLSLYLQMVGRVMRPAHGKNVGFVLDNASLWLEHGLTTIEHEWSLKGNKKKKNEIYSVKEIALDKEGVIREVHRTRPIEVQGLQLMPITIEFERLLEFESYLTIGRGKNHKLLAAYYKYRDNIKNKGLQIASYEFEYIKKRLDYFNAKVDTKSETKYNTAFWYRQIKELKEQGLFYEYNAVQI